MGGGGNLVAGEIELRELDAFDEDLGAFLACKRLWEWEHEYWIKKLKNGVG